MEVASKENLAHLTELNQLFMDIDKNNDGSLSVKEVRDALRSFNWTEEDIQKLLDCLLDSADDDAEVSYEEFMVNLMSATGNEENALLERIFREMDKTGRGTLDLNDIEELLKLERVRQVLGGRDAASLLKMMDSDGDNFVTLEEFKAVMCGVSTSQLSSTSIRLPKQRPPVHDSILRTFRPVPRQSAGMQYSKSQPVDYYSTTHNQWIRTTIAEVDPAKGVTVSVKIGVWLTGEELKNRVKPVSEMETIQES
jgi:Ca2+-binding EF-hand superfamily protein